MTTEKCPNCKMSFTTYTRAEYKSLYPEASKAELYARNFKHKAHITKCTARPVITLYDLLRTFIASYCVKVEKRKDILIPVAEFSERLRLQLKCWGYEFLEFTNLVDALVQLHLNVIQIPGMYKSVIIEGVEYKEGYFIQGLYFKSSVSSISNNSLTMHDGRVRTVEPLFPPYKRYVNIAEECMSKSCLVDIKNPTFVMPFEEFVTELKIEVIKMSHKNKSEINEDDIRSSLEAHGVVLFHINTEKAQLIRDERDKYAKLGIDPEKSQEFADFLADHYGGLRSGISEQYKAVQYNGEKWSSGEFVAGIAFKHMAKSMEENRLVHWREDEYGADVDYDEEEVIDLTMEEKSAATETAEILSHDLPAAAPNQFRKRMRAIFEQAEVECVETLKSYTDKISTLETENRNLRQKVSECKALFERL
jgi:hypothetical protein